MTQELQISQKETAKKFEDTLGRYKQSLTALLQQHGMSADKFIVTATNCIKKTPKLLQCDSKSLFAAILTAAELGLDPNTPMGYCYIIPYNGEATFQIGYSGLVSLAHRSGIVTNIRAEVVYDNDEFDYNLGLDPKLEHKPCIKGDRGEYKGVYAVITLNDGTRTFSFLPVSDTDKIKKMSKGGVWGSNKDPLHWMEKKTAVKQALKLIPKDNYTALAMKVDNVIEGGGRLTLDDSDDVTVEIIGSEEVDKEKEADQISEHLS